MNVFARMCKSIRIDFPKTSNDILVMYVIYWYIEWDNTPLEPSFKKVNTSSASKFHIRV